MKEAKGNKGDRKMKALVTGGAGFIGSHLCELLLERGYTVSVIDDLSTGCHENIAHLEEKDNFRLVIDTVLNRALTEELVKSSDTIFHLASAVGVNLIIQQPVKTIKTIIEGTDIVLTYACRYRKKVLITSSSEVYGKGSKMPFSEHDDTVLGPTTTRRWAYAGAKAVDEFLALAYWYETRLPVVCTRLFNTVGPRQIGQYGMVIPRLVRQALLGEPMTVYGDGEQTRTFCHVKDVIYALEKIINCRKAYGKVVNIGAPDKISINDLALRIKQLTSSNSQIVHISYNQVYVKGFEDMRDRMPDISLANELIGFQPRYTIDDILRSVIDYYTLQLKDTGE